MRKHKKATAFLKQKSYMLAAALMLMAVFGMTGVYVFEEKEENAKLQLAQQEKQEEPQTTAVDQVIEPENNDFLDEPQVVSTQEPQDTEPEETDAEEPQTQENTEPETETDTQETAGPVQKQLTFNAEEMQWPLQGNVIMNYSMGQTIYFATLDQYKYNPAIVIQGNVNDKVRAVAEGKVSNIETNEVTGCTVAVEMGDGYTAIYGQLKEVSLEAGDYVSAGDIVGYVSEPTKYYSVEGPNLYFQMLKDNESVDPMEYLQ